MQARPNVVDPVLDGVAQAEFNSPENETHLLIFFALLLCCNHLEQWINFFWSRFSFLLVFSRARPSSAFHPTTDRPAKKKKNPQERFSHFSSLCLTSVSLFAGCFLFSCCLIVSSRKFRIQSEFRSLFMGEKTFALRLLREWVRPAGRAKERLRPTREQWNATQTNDRKCKLSEVEGREMRRERNWKRKKISRKMF